MITQTVGFVAEAVVPSGGHITCKSHSGEVRFNKPVTLAQVITPIVDSSMASKRTFKW